MKKEIKFRAFYEPLGMYKVGKMELLEETLSLVNDNYNEEFEDVDFNDVKLMQFTGLHDKNGTEIYEGDIVEVYDFTNPYAKKYSGQVVFRKSGFYVKVYNEIFDKIDFYNLVFDDFSNRKTRIIGNIYENPELLE